MTADAIRKPKGLALAALITGILAVLGAVIGWGGVLLGPVAIGLGIAGLMKSQSRGMSVTGIVTGTVGLVLGLAVVVVVGFVFAILGVTVTIGEW